jgi:hypothetical protein
LQPRLIPGAANADAFEATRHQPSGGNRAGGCGADVGEVAFVLQDCQKLPVAGAENRHHATRGRQADGRVFIEAGRDLDDKDPVAAHRAIFDVHLAGGLLEQQFADRRNCCQTPRIQAECGLHLRDDVDTGEGTFDLGKIHDSGHASLPNSSARHKSLLVLFSAERRVPEELLCGSGSGRQTIEAGAGHPPRNGVNPSADRTSV